MKKKVNYDHSIDIMLIGYSSVGKSAISDRYFGKEFNDDDNINNQTQQTLKDNEIQSKIIELDSKKIKLTVISSFYNKFRPDRIPTYRVDGIIIVYDVTSLDSFEIAKESFSVAKRWSRNDIIITLAGNKVDLIEANINNDIDQKQLQRSISIESIKEFINQVGISNYIECSARYNINVDNLFIDIVSRVYIKIKQDIYNEQQKQINNRNNNNNEKSNNSCIIN